MIATPQKSPPAQQQHKQQASKESEPVIATVAAAAEWPEGLRIDTGTLGPRAAAAVRTANAAEYEIANLTHQLGEAQWAGDDATVDRLYAELQQLAKRRDIALATMTAALAADYQDAERAAAVERARLLCQFFLLEAGRACRRAELAHAGRPQLAGSTIGLAESREARDRLTAIGITNLDGLADPMTFPRRVDDATVMEAEAARLTSLAQATADQAGIPLPPLPRPERPNLGELMKGVAERDAQIKGRERAIQHEAHTSPPHARVPQRADIRAPRYAGRPPLADEAAAVAAEVSATAQSWRPAPGALADLRRQVDAAALLAQRAADESNAPPQASDRSPARRKPRRDPDEVGYEDSTPGVIV